MKKTKKKAQMGYTDKLGKKFNNLSEILATGMMAANYLIPEEKTKWPVVRPQLSYNPYPQGTGSQAIAKNGITISETGYKRNSKDKNKSKLRIPSNVITMENVDFPVLGTSDNGITKMMYPGENHVFPGANFVDEERVVAQKGATVRQPIYTSNPNDPRLRAYNDSLNLYKAYQFQKNNSAIPYNQWLQEFGQNYPGGPEALKKEREKNLGKPGTKTSDEKMSRFIPDRPDSDYDPPYSGDNKIINYYKSLVGNDKDFRIGKHNSPDLWHKNIKSVGMYYDGADSPIYKKPVQPVIYQQEPKIDAPDKRQTSYSRNLGMLPINVNKPNVSQSLYDPTKPTNWSFTYPTGEYNQQNTMYFPDETMWKNFINKQRNVTSQQDNNSGSATGYMEYGGVIPDISKNRKKFKHGGKIEPLTNDVVQFNGPSHADGGIDIEFGNKQVEVEGGETGYLSPIDNSFNVMGNMINPITGKKFKQDSKILAKKEQKVDKLLDYSLDLVENSNPRDKWDLLKFNSGAAQLQGAYKKKQQIQESKEHLSNIQKAMLDFANENGADPIKFSKGGIIFPSKKQILGKAQAGKKLSIAQEHNNPGNIMWPSKKKNIEWIESLGGIKGKYGEKPKNYYVKFPDLASGQKAMQQLLFERQYKNNTVWDVVNKWTGGEPYATIPQELKGKKMKDLSPQERIKILDAFTLGEDSKKYNWEGAESEMPKEYEHIQDLEEALKTEKYNIKKKPTSFGDYEYNPQKVGKSNYNLELTNPDKIENDSYLRDLSFEQIAPELMVAATNKPEPVFMQEYTPDLYQPYNVSFQDQLNENTATFKPLMKYNAKNPAIQATLAAQEYGADQSVLANEFRTNQGNEADIVNKNIALLNDAELKNLQLADTQYIRQDKARSNTRIQNIGILQSISDKLVQNEAEKRNFQVMKNLFPYYSFDKNYNTNFVGPKASEVLTPLNVDGSTQENSTVIRSQDNKGNKRETTVTKPTVNQQMDNLKFDRERLKNVQFLADILRGPKNRFIAPQ